MAQGAPKRINMTPNASFRKPSDTASPSMTRGMMTCLSSTVHTSSVRLSRTPCHCSDAPSTSSDRGEARPPTCRRAESTTVGSCKWVSSMMPPSMQPIISGLVTMLLSISRGRSRFCPGEESAITARMLFSGMTMGKAREYMARPLSPNMASISGAPRAAKLVRKIPCTITPRFCGCFSNRGTNTAASR